MTNCISYYMVWYNKSSVQCDLCGLAPSGPGGFLLRLFWEGGREELGLLEGGVAPSEPDVLAGQDAQG